MTRPNPLSIPHLRVRRRPYSAFRSPTRRHGLGNIHCLQMLKPQPEVAIAIHGSLMLRAMMSLNANVIGRESISQTLPLVSI